MFSTFYIDCITETEITSSETRCYSHEWQVQMNKGRGYNLPVTIVIRHNDHPPLLTL